MRLSLIIANGVTRINEVLDKKIPAGDSIRLLGLSLITTSIRIFHPA